MPDRKAKISDMRPLRRKPKTLSEEPSLHDVSPSAGQGTGLTLPGEPGDRSAKPATSAGSGGPATTEEQAALVSPFDDTGSDAAEGGRVDLETLRRAREIATRLAVPRPRSDRTARRGRGEVASVPYRGGSDDIDLDRTLEQLTEHPVPEDEDIVVRERVTTTRSVVLLVDLSGSMRGERARTAAAAVGALAAELARDNLGVIAFWSDAAVLAHLGQHVPPERLVESMLQIPARGLTNIAFPLQVARRELGRVPARDARVLLLSDCVHNAGQDPRTFAARLPRLDILLDTTGEQDPELARDLARLGRGRLRQVRTYRDVAPALSDFFAS
ncbi:MAG: vWA domain-containing protein [Trebonia sp.]